MFRDVPVQVIVGNVLPGAPPSNTLNGCRANGAPPPLPPVSFPGKGIATVPLSGNVEHDSLKLVEKPVVVPMEYLA